MKIGNRKLFTFGILITIVVIFSFRARDYVKDHECDSLEALAKKEDVRQKIWSSITKYKYDPYFLSNLYQKNGVVYIKNIDGHLGLKWDELGIPLRHATIEIKGKNINYNKIVERKVEEIRVGLGYRDHIVFKINKIEDNLKSKREFFLSVECIDSEKKIRKIDVAR